MHLTRIFGFWATLWYTLDVITASKTRVDFEGYVFRHVHLMQKCCHILILFYFFAVICLNAPVWEFG